jgi:ubiquinone/menaquinone biosynthesis C-methylase UbiE
MTRDPDGWQLAGTAPEVYERVLVPAVTRPWANDLVDRTGVRPGDRVLDVACGTGVVARVASQRLAGAGRAVGLDVNPGMLAVARSLPPAPGAPIEWIEGSAVALPFASDVFEVVLCQLGLQFFPDRMGALHEMRRVLVPGGRAGVSVFSAIERNPATHALSEALDAHVGPEASLVKRNEHSLADASELGDLFRGAGFSHLSVETVTRTVRFASVNEYVNAQFTGSPLASLVAGREPDDRRGLIALVAADVGASLAPFTVDGSLAFPQQVHVAVASA